MDGSTENLIHIGLTVIKLLSNRLVSQNSEIM